MTRDEIDADLVRRLLRYEPETGKMFWRPRSPDLFADDAKRTAEQRCHWWNVRFAGRETAARVTSSCGYPVLGILGRSYLAHRVAWLLVYGEWPSADLDHIDMDKLNFRLSNLREATRAENMSNKPLHSRNTTGVKGTHIRKSSGGYRVRIGVCGHRILVGEYSSPAAAARAYDDAAEFFFGSFALTNRALQC